MISISGTSTKTIRDEKDFMTVLISLTTFNIRIPRSSQQRWD